MINLNKNIESLTKIILFIFFLLNPTITLAEINDKKWSKQCVKNICYVAVTKYFKDSQSGKVKSLSTAIVLLNPEQKNSEAIINLLFPMGADLTKVPLISIDGQKIGNLTYLNCKVNQGCLAELGITNAGIKEFKKGKVLSAHFVRAGLSETYILEFTLKGFTKAYKSISK